MCGLSSLRPVWAMTDAGTGITILDFRLNMVRYTIRRSRLCWLSISHALSAIIVMYRSKDSTLPTFSESEEEGPGGEVFFDVRPDIARHTC